VLPREPLLEVFADPAGYNAVPVILGSNRDEYKLFLWNDDRFTERRFGLLPRLRDPQDYDRFTGYFSDQWRVSGVNAPAAVLARSQPGQVWAYRFDWDEQPIRWGIDMSRLFGAAHGIEVVFLFGREAVASLPLFAQVDDPVSWDGLSDAMLQYWARFARTGDPAGGDGGLPRWTPWGAGGQTKLVLDAARGGGIGMTDENLRAEDLKARLREDPAIGSVRERCERHAQLFLLGFSRDFWDPAEYLALGCGEFPVDQFRYVL
jgi:para-nitrobenzyl esterase